MLLSGRWVGRQAHGRSDGPGALAVGQLTLHGGPVELRPVRATPCFKCILSFLYLKFVLLVVLLCDELSLFAVLLTL